NPPRGRRLGGQHPALSQQGAGGPGEGPRVRRPGVGGAAGRRALRMAVSIRRYEGGDLAGMDFERFRLRSFLESLDSSELERVETPVALADVAGILEGNPR